MTGGTVCRVHGGTAPQVRYKSLLRVAAQRLGNQFEAEYARWVREVSEWEARRVAVTAELLELRPEQVTPFAIGICRSLYGHPDGEDTRPRLRTDRRFRPPVAPRAASRPRRAGAAPPGDGSSGQAAGAGPHALAGGRPAPCDSQARG